MTRFKQSVMCAGFVVGALATATAFGAEVSVKLSGMNEVPPVTTSAAGSGEFTVGDDGSISGSVTTTGVNGTMAHIHVGAAGTNGGVIVPLVKEGDTYKTPAGAKLTPEQMKALKEGGLYVNVHSAAHPGGEVRAQLQ